ncbi:two-component sensor histidine kinase [Micrococcales bacterium 31B]|nr:two-component sensor histidine kinase [Micrococcales bacterium 31B]
MNNVLVWLAMLIALLVGVFCTLAVVRYERPRTSPATATHLHDTGAQEVLAALRQSYVIFNRDGEVERANASAYSHGLVRTDSSRILRLTHPELVAAVKQVSIDGTPLDDQFTLSRGIARAERSVYGISISPLGADRLLLLADDLTREQRVEDTRRDFVANVSHELKTPVGAMLVLAETLIDAADDPKAVRRFSERIKNESNRLSSLVQEIIELSRVQATSALSQASRVTVTSVVREAVARSTTLAETRRVTLAVGQIPDLTVYGDANLLTTAISNLVSNAILYSPSPAKVGVGVRSVTRDGIDCVEIAVSDEGVGIAPQDLGRIFERFYRVDPARSRHTGGNGLGLAIVKHIAEDHGGLVKAWSQVGQGSTFTLRLPLATSHDPVRAASPTSPNPGGKSAPAAAPAPVPDPAPEAPERPAPQAAASMSSPPPSRGTA